MKTVHDIVLDAALDYLANNVTRMTLCSQAPTTYTEANSTFALTSQTLDSGDFSKANGDVSGRKTTIVTQTGVPVTATGIGTHIALLDVSGTTLLYVTEENTVQDSGTAQAGGASTITLETTASPTDDDYNNFYVRIIGGTGLGQSRRITDYVGSTRVATVGSAWITQPDSTTIYEVFGQSVTSGNAADFAAWDIEIEDPT